MMVFNGSKLGARGWSFCACVLAVLFFVLAGHATAQDVEAPELEEKGWTLRFGAQVGGTFTYLQGDNQEGGGFLIAPDLRVYSPDGFGVLVRPFLELGSPNLLGGDVGAAYRGTLARVRPDVALMAGGAVGITGAARFYVSGCIGIGPGPCTGDVDPAHFTGGYFAEAHIEFQIRRLYVGLAVVHHGFLFDTSTAGNRSPMWNISPRVQVGGTWDL